MQTLTGKQLLETKDYTIDLSLYKHKPECDLHPKADIYNIQYSALKTLAQERPQRALECYECLEMLDDKLNQHEQIVAESI